MSTVLRNPRSPAAVFGVAATAATALLLVWFGDLTFWRQEWALLLERGADADAFLEPLDGGMAVGLVGVYRGLLAVFGMDSALPFQAASTAALLLSAGLLFIYLRRRLGGWFALALTLPILVLGPAWEVLLWPYAVGLILAMAAGLGALLALERNDSAGDLLACVLLVIAVLCSGFGVAFVAGAAVEVLWDRRRGRRFYVPLVPGVLLAVWWLGWGLDGSSQTSLADLATSLGYVLDGFASSLASLTGLASRGDPDLSGPVDWGRVLLLVGIALAAWRLWRVGSMSRALWVVTAVALAFWLLAALDASPAREADSSLHQYPGAVMVALIVAELLRGWRPTVKPILALMAAAAVAVLGNLSGLRDAQSTLAGFGERQPAGLAAIELAQDAVDPDFVLTEENSGVDFLGLVEAGPYLTAVDEHGSPAYTEEELAGASEAARASADLVFAAALRLALEPEPAGIPFIGACAVSRSARPGDPAIAELPSGGAVIEASRSGAVRVGLRRYARDAFPIDAGTVGAGERAILAIPADRSPRPWQVELRGPGPLRLCGPVG